MSDKPVWDLLQHAGKVEASPMFARNVVREVRLDSSRDLGWLSSVKEFFATRSALIGGTVTAAIAVAFVVLVEPERDTITEIGYVDVENFDPTSEMEEVEYLGQLMAVVDPGQLSDEALADLFF